MINKILKFSKLARKMQTKRKPVTNYERFTWNLCFDVKSTFEKGVGMRWLEPSHSNKPWFIPPHFYWEMYFVIGATVSWPANSCRLAFLISSIHIYTCYYSTSVSEHIFKDTLWPFCPGAKIYQSIFYVRIRQTKLFCFCTGGFIAFTD